MHKNWNKDKHQKIYIGLSVVIFALAGLAHLCIALKGWTIQVGFINLPLNISWHALFIAICMVVMGLYYVCKK